MSTSGQPRRMTNLNLVLAVLQVALGVASLVVLALFVFPRFGRTLSASSAPLAIALALVAVNMTLLLVRRALSGRRT